MGKHLFGVAVFISITTMAVLVHWLLSMPVLPTIPAVDSVQEVAHGRGTNKRLGTRILTAEYDVATGSLVADIELVWKDREAEASKLEYRVYLLERARSGGFWPAASDVVAFALNEDRKARRVTFMLSDLGDIDNLDNVYMYVEASPNGHLPAGGKVLPENAVYVPVLRVHK